VWAGAVFCPAQYQASGIASHVFMRLKPGAKVDVGRVTAAGVVDRVPAFGSIRAAMGLQAVDHRQNCIAQARNEGARQLALAPFRTNGLSFRVNAAGGLIQNEGVLNQCPARRG